MLQAETSSIYHKLNQQIYVQTVKMHKYTGYPPELPATQPTQAKDLLRSPNLYKRSSGAMQKIWDNCRICERHWRRCLGERWSFGPGIVTFRESQTPRIVTFRESQTPRVMTFRESQTHETEFRWIYSFPVRVQTPRDHVLWCASAMFKFRWTRGRLKWFSSPQLSHEKISAVLLRRLVSN